MWHSVRVFFPPRKEYKVLKKPKQTQKYDVFYGCYPKKLHSKNMQIYLKGLGAYDGKYETLRCFSTFDSKI